MPSDEVCVLIAEKDPSSRAYLRTFLRREGISVEAVGDGAGALKVLAVRKYSLILLELSLGSVDGFEVLDFMHRNGIKTPVIVISAADEDLLGRAQASPLVKLVMQKPVDAERLTVIVQSFCAA